MEVAEDAERPLARAGEELAVEPVGLVGSVLAVAGRERLELARVTIALAGEPVADVEDVGLVAVRARDLAERLAELALRPVQEPEVVGELRQGTTTRTAATLKIGCLETGSQPVTVSSFAARGTASSASQLP